MSADNMKEFFEWLRYWLKKIVMAFQFVKDWKEENIDPYFVTETEATEVEGE